MRQTGLYRVTMTRPIQWIPMNCTGVCVFYGFGTRTPITVTITVYRILIKNVN